MTYDPPPSRGTNQPYFGTIARPPGSSIPTEAELHALSAMVEGSIGAQQPIRFIRHMFRLHLLELIETRGGAYHLTATGRSVLQPKEKHHV